MGTEGRRTDRSVTEHLFERGYEFDFFQAVRLLARIYPGRKPVGRDHSPEEEIVRFRGHYSLGFPPSEIHQVTPEGGSRAEMQVAFLGLAGRQGVLPLHYTEQILQRWYEYKDDSLAAFLDLFHHRLTSFFYRAWEKYRLPAQYEAEEAGWKPRERGCTQYLFDLIGMGTAGLRGHLAGLPDHTLLPYAGLIAQRPHSAAALEGMLRDYFQVPVRVRQFQGRWFPLADEELSYMHGEGAYNQLGEGATAGDAVWNPQARVRLEVGPLAWDRFRAFLPGGGALAKFAVLTRFFLDQSIDFEIQVGLQAGEVPMCSLGDEEPHATMLGLSTWLRTDPFEEDARDVVLSRWEEMVGRAKPVSSAGAASQAA